MYKSLIINNICNVEKNEKMNEIIKKNVKRICKKWKMSQEEMSVSFGLSSNAIANMIADRRNFPPELIQGLSELCHVSMHTMETVELSSDAIPERVTMKVADPKPQPNEEVLKVYIELVQSQRETIEYQKELINFLKSKM